MFTLSVIGLFVASQSGWATKGFDGFVPNAQVAVEVAKPLLKSALGDTWLKHAYPLKADLKKDRWVVSGTYKTANKSSADVIVEPYIIAIDKWSGRVAVFGPSHLIDLKKQLDEITSDRPTSHKKSK